MKTKIQNYLNKQIRKLKEISKKKILNIDISEEPFGEYKFLRIYVRYK